jgi:predicted HAD superfamily Cof-like phosphohydrolase
MTGYVQTDADADFEDMLAAYDRIIADKEQQELLDAGLLVRIEPPSLNPWQQAVADFHEAMDLAVATTPAVPDRSVSKLRRDLIAEEAKELDEELFWLDVVANPSYYLPALAKEMADLIYVILGTAVSFGIDMGPVFEAVHASNMAKAGGPVRSDGKRLKPQGWQPPDIAKVLEAQVAAR